MAEATWLFVHDLPGDRRVFAKSIVDAAPAGVRVVLLDLLDSGDRPEELSLDPALVELDVERAIESLAVAKPITVIGVGAGAYLCARLLSRARERVARAVLISGFAAQPDELVEERLALALELESGDLSEAEHRALLLRQWLGQTHATPDAMRTAAAMLDVPRPRLVRAWRRLAACTAPVAPFDTPTSVVHALGDALVPVADAEALADLGENALPISLETDAHLLPLTHAAEIAEIVYASAAASPP